MLRRKRSTSVSWNVDLRQAKVGSNTVRRWEINRRRGRRAVGSHVLNGVNLKQAAGEAELVFINFFNLKAVFEGARRKRLLVLLFRRSPRTQGSVLVFAGEEVLLVFNLAEQVDRFNEPALLVIFNFAEFCIEHVLFNVHFSVLAISFLS